MRQVRLEPGAASTQTALYWIKSARSDFVEQCPFHSIHEYPTRSQERINLSHNGTMQAGVGRDDHLGWNKAGNGGREEELK